MPDRLLLGAAGRPRIFQHPLLLGDSVLLGPRGGVGRLWQCTFPQIIPEVLGCAVFGQAPLPYHAICGLSFEFSTCMSLVGYGETPGKRVLLETCIWIGVVAQGQSFS